jgi:adenine-specific DNA-methyltransferase
MPTLDWIGKSAVVNHHREVPTRLLHCDGALSAGDADAGNLLVEGDNLEALKALLPYYGGQVKCIYIDPPYNTGKDDWRYSDKVDDPTIKAWLGQAIGPESEDFTRHEKWLCMMYPRLMLLRDFLTEDGIVICSIDQNEFAYLRILMDSIFTRRNWVGDLVWKNVTDNNPSRVVMEHEYMLIYAKDISRLPAVWKSSRSDVKARIETFAAELIQKCGDDEPRLQKEYAEWFKANKAHLWPFQEYDQIDFQGVYTESRSVHNPGKEGYFWDLVHPTTGKITKKPLMGYRFPEDTRDELLARNEIVFGKDENQIIRLKIPLSRYVSKLPSVLEFDGRRGSNEIREILNEEKRAFANPKPSDMLADILSYVTNSGDLILDSFAGSGTTGHAVWTLDRRLRESRRFVLVEMKPDIAQNVTSLRLSRVSSGYQRKKRDGSEEPVPGLGSGFRYCTLGKPLFDEWGTISEGVSFADLAAFVFFSDTGSPIPAKAAGKTSLLGTFQNRAVHLLWSAESAGVANAVAGNVLTAEALAALPKPSPDFDGAAIVYGEGCTVTPERLAAAGVTFKQIPYQVIGA